LKREVATSGRAVTTAKGEPSRIVAVSVEGRNGIKRQKDRLLETLGWIAGRKGRRKRRKQAPDRRRCGRAKEAMV
jgi:hypothetical protein